MLTYVLLLMNKNILLEVCLYSYRILRTYVTHNQIEYIHTCRLFVYKVSTPILLRDLSHTILMLIQTYSVNCWILFLGNNGVSSQINPLRRVFQYGQ